MHIHYNEITKRVTGFTGFIDPVPAIWDKPTVEVAEFDFAGVDVAEYEIQGELPVHVGKSAEMIAAASAIKVKLIENYIQSHLDNGAKERGYDSVLSACSYVGYPNPYENDGKSFIAWRGNVWAYCYTALAEVQAGTRTEPTLAELLAELPVFVEVV